LRIFGFVAGACSLLVFVLAGCLLLPTCAGPELMPDAGRLTPGLDFEGGAQLVYSIDVPEDADRDEALSMVIDIIGDRLDDTDVTAAVFRRGDDVVVELPGVDAETVAQVMEPIGHSAHLEFRVVDDLSEVIATLDRIPVDIERDTETTSAGEEHPMVRASYLRATGEGARERLAGFVQQIDAGDREIVIGVDDYWEGGGDPYDPSAPPERAFRTWVVHREAPVDGTMVADAYVGQDSQANRPVVQLAFDDTGREAFARITGGNVKRRMAIMLDGEVASAPVVNERISGGRAQISLGAVGAYDQTLIEANDLVITLRAGALPSPLTLSEETLIAPAYDASLAALIPTVLTVLLLLLVGVGSFRYRGATLSLLSPLLMVVPGFAALAWTGAVVTLPAMIGVTAVALVGLVFSVAIAERIRGARARGEATRRFHLINVLAPHALMVIIGTLATIVLLMTTGATRGFMVGVVAVAVPGALIAFLWPLAMTATFSPPSPD